MSKMNSIGKLAKLFNVPISTLHYWENEGLIKFDRLPENNYRLWSLRTIRTLCDITFYRKLSIKIKELRKLHNMSYTEIENLLSKNREDLCNQIKTMQETVNNIDIKLGQIQTIRELRNSPMEFVTTSFPAVRPFELTNSDDLSNLITHEKNLIVMIDYDNPNFYRYGVFVSDNDKVDTFVRDKDEKPRLYLRVLLCSSYSEIEKNNLHVYYDYLYEHGYQPGLAMGKVLVSGFDDGLCNYYDTWIEAKPITTAKKY